MTARFLSRSPLQGLLLSIVLASPAYPADTADGVPVDALSELGRALFFEPGLSEPPGQSCATCHDPTRAFTDGRADAAGGALSLGADGRSLGDRNTPTLTYAAFVPHFAERDGEPSGGLFLDGRASDLAAQALQPMLNPLEMALPDLTALAGRIRGNAGYRDAVAALFGAEVLDDDGRLADAVSRAIAAFERSAELNRFDSKYDRHLAGAYTMTREEAIGRDLFFSDLINCVQCHLNEPGKVSPRETFTSHRYHNIGVPANEAARAANGLGRDHRDPGLAANPAAGDEAMEGRYRVPTLRNVAVTAPYMHNGVFESLEAAVAFYARYTSSNRPSRINPDTGEPWREPEVAHSIDLDLLSEGQPMDDQRIGFLVAFLKTLTDARYEHLLDGG